MRKVLLVMGLVCAAAQVSPQQDITAVLQHSAQDWSRGDLGAFMQSYEQSPNTEYIAKSGPVHGYTAIRERYQRRYGSGHSTLGQLSFSELEIRLLSDTQALVTGRFLLRRSQGNGGDASGIFTLILHRSQAGWRIAYDHTS